MTGNKLLLGVILIIMVALSVTTESVMAMIVKLDNRVSPTEYNHSPDPCFEPNRGYICTPIASFEQLSFPQTEVTDDQSESMSSDFEEINNSLW